MRVIIRIIEHVAVLTWLITYFMTPIALVAKCDGPGHREFGISAASMSVCIISAIIVIIIDKCGLSSIDPERRF